MSLFSELKRRNVFRVAIAYLAGSWLLIEVAGTIFPLFGFDDTPARILVIVLAIGFPLFLLFSWVFELTPEGLKLESDIDLAVSVTRHTGKKLDRVIIALLALALGYFAIDKFVLEPARVSGLMEETAQQARSDALVESYGDKSIAVLPFVDMSATKDQEYMSDGIAEELLNLLARVPQLRVVSRSSAFSFKDQNLEISEIATRLNVAHILEGSVRKAGNQLRITAQLIEARSDTHLWSATYDRNLDDIFAIQDEIAAEVVSELKVTLLGKDIPKAMGTDPDAYALFLQSRHVTSRYTKEAFAQAEQLLNQALAIDPGYAPAWHELGEIYLVQEDFGRSVEAARELALAAYQMAQRLDPSFASTYASLSLLARRNFDFAVADQYLQQALQLSESSSFPFSAAASLSRTFGRFDQSVELARKAISLNPVSSAAYSNLGYSLYYSGHLDEAAISFRTSISLDPNRFRAHFYLGRVLLAQGAAQEGLAAMQKVSSVYFRLTGLAMAYHALGDEQKSDKALAELDENWSEIAAFQIAEAHAFRGENDAALAWLHRALETRDAGLAVLLGNPVFTDLTFDVRYQSLVEKLGLLPYFQELR
jgi:adenylate cyclase